MKDCFMFDNIINGVLCWFGYDGDMMIGYGFRVMV